MGQRLKNRKNSGFSIVEMAVVMLTFAILLKLIAPNMGGMQTQEKFAKVDDGLVSLQNAVVSYWRSNARKFPLNISDLVATSPPILAAPLIDPFSTENATYGYQTGVDPSFGAWFAIYSRGPRGDTVAVDFEGAHSRIRFSGSGRVISNAPIVRY